MGLEPGYTGHMKFKSRKGDTFDISLSNPVLKNGQPYSAMQWDFVNKGNMVGWVTELTDSLFATYAPGLPVETDCLASGHCIPGHFGDQAYVFIPALGFAVRVSSYTAAPPTPYTVSYLDMYLEKIMPFSLANPRMSLDASGPHAIQTALGPNNKTCDMHMGMTYGDLLADCVQVSGNAMADQTELNKLLGGLSHGDERFRFDLSGVDVNFTDKTLPANDIVHDKDKPSNDDVATQFQIDQASLGKIANDYVGNDPTQAKDIHGTGFVYAEFLRLSQNALNAASGGSHPIGDPACLTGNPATFAAGCTGLEGFVVPLDPSNSGPVNDANLRKVARAFGTSPTSAMKGGLKPGHQNVVICNGLKNNAIDPATCVVSGDTFPTMYARVLAVLGGGKVSALPLDAQDARFFWKQWATAFVKYNLASTATDAGLKVSDVANAPLNPNDFFFDSVGSGQFEIAEYVDRRYAQADPNNAFENKQDITDLEIEADVRNGIFDAYQFSRDIYRGETALYAAMRTDSALPLGKEPNAYLTNIFGSQLLKQNWVDKADAIANPPLDDNFDPELGQDGLPILTPYLDFAFDNGTDFFLGKTQSGGGSPISVTKLYPNLQSATIHLPIHSNPADYLSALDGNHPGVDLLVPWLTKQPGVGFPIALSGTRDKFVETYQLDFSGTTLSANVDYDFVDPNDQTKGVQFLGVETTDYLGDVFLCFDPDTYSVLHARMYAPVAGLLDWISKHKTASDACGMIVRFSPYNNYPDYITSLAYGVRLGITQGGGFGRVVDTVLFVPGQ
jgi:hypothetical protein